METAPSLESLEFPWEKKRCPDRRVAYSLPAHEAGRRVSVDSFCLCLVGAMLFATGTLALAAAAWSLAEKTPYLRLVKVQFDVPHLSLPAAVLCLPTSLLAVSLHNSKRKRLLLPLLMVLEGVALLLFVVAGYLGLSPQNSASDPNRISSKNVNATLTEALLNYGKDSRLTAAIDRVQAKLGCCGVDSHNDYGRLLRTVPPNSCGRAEKKRGCKEALVRMLYAHMNVLGSINVVAAVNQAFCIVVVFLAHCYQVNERKLHCQRNSG